MYLKNFESLYNLFIIIQIDIFNLRKSKFIFKIDGLSKILST